MGQVTELAQRLKDVQLACAVLGVPRASYYRALRPAQPERPRPSPPRALLAREEQAILAVLHQERFQDLPATQVHALLLDEGQYLGSERTFYRVLAKHQESGERRAVLRHPKHKVPQLLAQGPNQVWSWDITKLLGPRRLEHYYLYVILDLFSRYVVGWLLALSESAQLAVQLIEESCQRQRVQRDQLTLHSDRGPSMTSQPVSELLARLEVQKSLSRPHVSNDNPYSEAHFKTFKYRPTFLDRFPGFEPAQLHCREFFPWYNQEHRHSGLAMFTPRDVHLGLWPEKLKLRQATLDAAFRAHPERFPRGHPKAPAPPLQVWINPPAKNPDATNGSGTKPGQGTGSSHPPFPGPGDGPHSAAGPSPWPVAQGHGEAPPPAPGGGAAGDVPALFAGAALVSDDGQHMPGPSLGQAPRTAI